MTPILAFDIETVPDAAGIRKLYELPEEVWSADVNGALNHFEVMPTDGPDSLADDTEYRRFPAPTS